MSFFVCLTFQLTLPQSRISELVGAAAVAARQTANSFMIKLWSSLLIAIFFTMIILLVLSKRDCLSWTQWQRINQTNTR